MVGRLYGVIVVLSGAGRTVAPNQPIKSMLLDAYDAAVSACDPHDAVADAIQCDDTGITIGGNRFEGVAPADITIVAIGKAASSMVRGAVSILGQVGGIAVSNHKAPCPVTLLVGAHPVPDETSLACGEAVISFVEKLSPKDVVLYLVSGGGSSIAVAPVPGVSLQDLEELNSVLMTAGVPIGAMNAIRASVSRIKGGRLAASCQADRSVTLVLSDVVGEGPSHVSSGPSIGAHIGDEAARVVRDHELEQRLPPAVLDAISEAQPEAAPRDMPYAVIGSSAVAAEAALAFLQSRGVPCSIASTEMEGEARSVAETLVREAAPGVVTIAAGETTVTVTGNGIGGRNQEGALAAAISIAGTDTVFLACGTDGIDGPTPAAGAVVDGGTFAEAVDWGIDLDRALHNNDSYTALAGLDAVVLRGDTGTNVGDIWMIAEDVAVTAEG